MTKRRTNPKAPSWANRSGTDRTGQWADVELAPGVVMRLRWIPPGSFLMGSPEGEAGRYSDEGPQHRVTLTKGYWLADAPCTQAQWRAVMVTNPSHFEGGDFPVERVNWQDCQSFCEKLRARFPGLEARLPTEAEWEYGCRAGQQSDFNDGSSCTDPCGPDPALLKLGWFDKNGADSTHLVCGFPPNRWGLYDMHGNVGEWCADWYGGYSSEMQTDPTGPVSGRARVYRGGSWLLQAWLCRSACRLWWPPVDRLVYLGFRLAAGQSGQPQPSQERAAGERAGRSPAILSEETADGKLARIRVLINQWDQQPDPESGKGDCPEAADVIYQIVAILDE